MRRILSLLIVLGCSVASSKTLNLTTKNTVVLNTAINKMAGQIVMVTLEDMIKKTPKDKPIYLVIHSPGGDPETTFRIANVTMKARNVFPVVSDAYSAAALLVQLIPNKRYILKDGLLTFHKGYVYICGQGHPSIFQKFLNTRMELHKTISKITSLRLGIKVEKYEKEIEDGEWELNSEQAVKNNAADEIVDVECSGKFINYVQSLDLHNFICKE